MRNKRKILSILLTLSLLLGTLSPALAVRASNAISDNVARQDVNTSVQDIGAAVFSEENDELSSISNNTADNSQSPDSDEAVTDESTFPSSDESVSDEPASDESASDESVSDESASDESVSDDTPFEQPADPSEESLDSAGDEESYTLIFDYNGGVDANGNTSFQVTAPAGEFISPYMQQAEDQNFISPYRFLNKWDMYRTDTGELYDTNQKVTNKKKVIANYTFKAVWSTEYENFDITYVLNGGSFTETDTVPYSYTYADENITLPQPVQKGYIFGGFYTTPDFTSEAVTAIPKNSLGDITLYANWISAVPTTVPTLKKVTNPSRGNAKITFTKIDGVSGYELLMSTNKAFKKNTNTIHVKANVSSVTITNLPKNKTYYFKLRAYATDSTGEKAYTAYSKSLKKKITKGVAEYKATATSAKLQTCKITNTDTLNVKFKVTKRIKSSDDSYYLVRVNPANGKYEKKLVAAAKQKTVTFELPLKDDNGNNLIQGYFALAVKNGKSYKLISKPGFISNPEAAATYTDPFPVTKSKKGLQGSTDLSLGIKHTFFNMDLNSILNGSIPYKYNGKTYYFNDPWQSVISACNEAGLTVTGQIMLSYNASTKYMILKSGRTPGKPFYAINAQEKKARETFEAAMSFLAERYSRSDCHLDNWILGNEVNIHQAWYYAGNISREKFMKNYADTYRIMYYAVKGNSKNSRVYICTDHTWIDRAGDWGAKPFMNAFDKEIKSQQKNIRWNLAYHAYPSILTSAATWNDKYAPNSNDADFVSPKNLDILTKYVKKNFGKDTRIILSEQGFTSTSGMDVQAAAIAYTFYKAEFNDMIDAVIFRSDFDNEGEMAQGLYFGLQDIKGNKKPAYNVFKYMDTPQAETYTNPYLKTIGISKWKDIAPKYNLKRFE